MAIAYQVLILHDSGTSGPGRVISAGKTDLTADGKYNASTCTVRTDSPVPAFAFSDPEKTQYHAWDGSIYTLTDKPYNPSTEAVKWNGKEYKTNTVAESLGGKLVGFLVSSIPASGVVKLIGVFDTVATGLTGDLATDGTASGQRVGFTVNSITTGGDIVLTGNSRDPKTGLVTTSDTETITVDTTAGQIYITDKEWLEITNVNVTSGAITGINYDIGVDGTETFFNTDVRITGYRFIALSNGATSDFRLRISKFSADGDKKATFVEIEDIGIDSTGGNGSIVDGIRSGVDDRDYTYGSQAFPNDRSFVFSQNDFDSYFSADENIIFGSNGEGLIVEVRGQGQVAMTNIENFRLLLKIQSI